MCNNNRSIVFLFNFSACFSNEIQTWCTETSFYRHIVTLFWGPLTGALPLDPAGGLPFPDPLLTIHSPCHYILDKGLIIIYLKWPIKLEMSMLSWLYYRANISLLLRNRLSDCVWCLCGVSLERHFSTTVGEFMFIYKLLLRLRLTSYRLMVIREIDVDAAVDKTVCLLSIMCVMRHKTSAAAST